MVKIFFLKNKPIRKSHVVMPNYLITLQTLTNRGFYSIDLNNIIKERERERECRRLVYASGFFQLKKTKKKTLE
jgi:hypothetical protein